MEEIIEQLRKELAKIFGQITSDNFVGFVRTDKQLQKVLELDFERGKILCVSIIKHSKGE